MELQTLLKATLKRHKGGLIGIFILIFIVSLSLATVLTVWNRSGSYLTSELHRAGFGDLTAWASGASDWDSLAEEIAGVDAVERVAYQRLIYTNYLIHEKESDSEGQLILYAPQENRYHFFTDDLSGYRTQPDKITPGEVYVSPSLASMFDAQIGDSIAFPIARAGKTLTLTIAGWYEDPAMGSSMIGMKGFLIGEASWNEALSILKNAGIDALAREGAMLHIFADDPSLPIAELNAQINKNTSLPVYTEFAHSQTAISGFMLVLQNAFSGLLLAFASVLLLAAMVVLGHHIQSGIEQDFINMGILKTVGFTSKKLRSIQLAAYLTVLLPGMLLGVAAAIPTTGFVNAMTLTTTGILVPSSLSIGLCLPAFAAVLFILTGFILYKLRKINRATPMRAIRGETDGGPIRIQSLPPIHGRRLSVSLALRQLLTSKRRYVGACLVAVLLVFFASLIGRMDAWLGADGKGMMDAFNPADHDLGVQSFGELTREEFEQTIQSYSDIRDTYVLAMPSVTVNGVDFTANVIGQPERFHLLEGRPSTADSEIVVTEFVAADLGVGVGDSLTVGADLGSDTYTISGIYSCANDMGRNIGMSRDAYLKISSDSPNLWCWHYFLSDPTQKPAIIEALETAYGGDIHIHENTWPGLFGIISAMRILVIFLYGMAALFILVVTAITGSKILAAEQKDLAIYKAIGFAPSRLRFTFALRLGMTAMTGAAAGTLLAALFTDPLVSAVMKLAGISNFASAPGMGTILFPGVFVTLLFVILGWFAAERIKRLDLTMLMAE